MLDNPATSSAQQGSRPSCALAGHGVVKTRTSAKIAARILWLNTQFLERLSSSVILFIFTLCFLLLVQQQVDENPTQLGRVGGVLFAKCVAMCDPCSLLAQFCSQQLLRQGLGVNAGTNRCRG